MKLKAHYDPATLTELAKSMNVRPRTTHVEVIHTGKSPEQNFDDQMIDEGKLHGWVSISGNRLQLKTDGEPLQYTIKRGPGYFCKSTGQAIPVSEKAWYRFRFASDSSLSRPEALAWLAKNGKDASDYDISVSYQCVLDPKQHERYRAVRDLAGNLVAVHNLQGA